MKIDRILLFPYFLALKLRNNYYNKSGRKTYSPNVPSVCIGNVAVGGSGKTPMVEYVLRMLQTEKDWADRNIAVISRGYLRESTGFQQVVPQGTAAMFGDEPMQIKKKFPNVTVVVDKNRVNACEMLKHPEKVATGKKSKKCWYKDFPVADYIVLDDAFQYRKLKPSKNVVMIDYNRPAFKDKLLPMGRLRDLPERIWEADVIVVTKCPDGMEAGERNSFAQKLGLTRYTPETCVGFNPSGRRQVLLFSKITYKNLVGVFENTEMRYVYSKQAIVVTGIANDENIRAYLSDQYKIVRHLSFPDHHKFTWPDISKIQAVQRKNPLASIITTEKDAQRLLDFPGMPQEIVERLLMLPIESEFLSESEKEKFRECITRL